MPNCHFNTTTPVPVGVITDLSKNIIIGNTFYTSEFPVRIDSFEKASNWVVSGARVMLTRFFASGNCSVVLVPHLPNMDDHPEPLPEEIGIERDFQLWLGYIEAVRQVEKSDLEESRLLPVFTGVIENIKSTASSTGGYTVQIQARDRVKWFMDSTLHYNSQQLGRARTIPRSELVWEILNRSIGVIREDSTDLKSTKTCGGCGKQVYFDSTWSVDIEASSLATNKTAPSDFYYAEGGPLQGGVLANKVTSINPALRVHTTRLAIDAKQEGNFLMADQIASEAIKVLSFQEVYPTEFFQDHRDGNLYYAPRGNEITGLSDPDRFYRTYYFKYAKPTSDVNQRIMALREEKSSIGLKTNVLVGPRASTELDVAWNENTIHLAAKPHSLRGVDYACKFTSVVDPSISNLVEAGIIALEHARIWSRETKAGMIVIMGDPSFVPAEVVQIVGSPLLSTTYLDDEVLEADKQKFIEFNTKWNELIKNYAEGIKTEKEKEADNINDGKIEINDRVEATIPIFDGSSADIKAVPKKDGGTPENIYCGDQHSRIIGLNGEGFNEPPQTIFRVEAIVHKFNQGTKGFVTELALVTPF